MTERDWVSVHVFYHGDLTALLIDAVGPLVAELTAEGLADGWFFLRYWEGGPHLRLRVLPVDDRRDETVRTWITERVGRYLREQPSAERIAQADYARIAAANAAREGMPVYTRRLHPNNSMAFLPYRREHDRYGHGARIEAVEEHFTASSRLALSLVAAEGWSARRDTIAFCLIMLAWLVCEPDPARLAGYCASPSWADDQNPDYADRFARQWNRLVTMTNGMRDLAAVLPEGTGALAEWGRSVLRLRETLADHMPETQVLRVLDTCAHLACNRLGFSMIEECYLRYLATRAVAALVGEENRVG